MSRSTARRRAAWLAAVAGGWLGVAWLGVAALTVVARAEPAAPVEGEVMVVLASEDVGAIEPALERIAALRKPPFDRFKSMKLLSRAAVKLDDGKPVTVALPNGRQLQLELLERMPDGRHKVQVSINRPDKKDYLPVLQVKASGEPFFVAGQKYQGATLVIGVRVGGSAKQRATK